MCRYCKIICSRGCVGCYRGRREEKGRAVADDIINVDGGFDRLGQKLTVRAKTIVNNGVLIYVIYVIRQWS